MSSNITNPLGFLFGSSNTEAKELNTNIIKIRPGTILLADKIINIRNLASVEVVTLGISFPWIAPILIIAGIAMGQDYSLTGLLGLALLSWGGYLIYTFFQRRNKQGLLLLLTSGVSGSVIITGIDTVFLREIALVLYNILTTNYQQHLDIYLDRRVINNINGANNAVIATGTVMGNITNSVK